MNHSIEESDFFGEVLPDLHEPEWEEIRQFMFGDHDDLTGFQGHDMTGAGFSIKEGKFSYKFSR